MTSRGKKLSMALAALAAGAGVFFFWRQRRASAHVLTTPAGVVALSAQSPSPADEQKATSSSDSATSLAEWQQAIAALEACNAVNEDYEREYDRLFARIQRGEEFSGDRENLNILVRNWDANVDRCLALNAESLAAMARFEASLVG